MDIFLRYLAVFLQWIFFLGLIGSALVIVLTSFEDIEVLFEKDEPQQPTEGAQHR